MPYKDPEKAKEYKKRWYKNNKKSMVLKAYINKKAQQEKMRRFVNQYKESKNCCKCPENDPICLDFHHNDPSKKDLTISRAINRGWCQERIMKEIKKCILICANCHRKLHGQLAKR